ncbi:MAG: hypothetical protein JXX14_15700, partial [Deltaproteobacteria bacterium]|nr:hypothetical protein [Deltaproteobacteria bacterium]
MKNTQFQNGPAHSRTDINLGIMHFALLCVVLGVGFPAACGTTQPMPTATAESLATTAKNGDTHADPVSEAPAD